MNDLISREALKKAFDCVGFNDYDDYNRALRIIDNAPTVEQPTGEWCRISLLDGYVYLKCSECGQSTRLVRDSKNEFRRIKDVRDKIVACPCCGAKMKGGAEE